MKNTGARSAPRPGGNAAGTKVRARAALEAAAFQTREVLDAANADADVPIEELKVDGGMVANDTLMQFQADILGIPVVRPKVPETTALGPMWVEPITARIPPTPGCPGR